MILQKIEELRRARSLHENDMPAYRGRLIADALHIHHDAQRRDHKAEIPGHGLGAGEDTQGRGINLIFQKIDGVIAVDDRLGRGRVHFHDGVAHVVHGNFRGGSHNEKLRPQGHNHLVNKIFLF